MKILVTGANGFVGNALVTQLLADKYEVMGTVRSQVAILPDGGQILFIPDIAEQVDWNTILEGIDVVIHTVARAHVMKERISDPLEEFRKINVNATLALAKASAKIGVKQFIFLSSIGVNGNNNSAPFTERDEACPHDLYAVSKLEAELELQALAANSKMDVTIIRPPLIYGPKAPGNFSSLIHWVTKNIPLPLGAIHNLRSLVALDNLVSFIIHCIDHPKAVNEVFLIADGEDVSTTTLLRKVANAFGKKPNLIPVPVGLMIFMAKLVGKGDLATRLFGSLQVDSSKARELLGWKPIITMDEQLKKTAEAYLRK